MFFTMNASEAREELKKQSYTVIALTICTFSSIMASIVVPSHFGTAFAAALATLLVVKIFGIEGYLKVVKLKIAAETEERIAEETFRQKTAERLAELRKT